MTGKDYPDWGGYPTSAQSYPLKDLAEAVVRLGSPVIYDRSGAVALLESFEFGLGHCELSLTGGGSLPALDNTHWNTNGFSALLAAGPLDGDGSYLAISLPVPPPGLWGLSARFTVPLASGRIMFGIMLFDPPGYWTGAIHYVADLGKWYYKDLAGGVVLLLDGWTPPLSEYLFHFLKLVIDPITHKYVRLVIDDTVIDMSGLDLYYAGGIAYSYLQVSVGLLRSWAAVSHTNIDDVILTYNESD